MIPPITATTLANAIQTKGMVAAGLDYWRQGRVTALQSDDAAGMATAKVRGKAKQPYHVTVVFSGKANAEASIRCTCPVGTGCKHGAALLFAMQSNQVARGQQATATPLPHLVPVPLHQSNALPAPLQRWLAETPRRPEEKPIDLAFVFSPRPLHVAKAPKGKAKKAGNAQAAAPLHAQRLAIAGSIRPRADTPSQAWQHAPVNQLRNVQMPLDAMDRWLVRRMDNYGGDLDHQGSPMGLGGGDWIERVIAMGRAHWRKAGGPVLHWGEDEVAQWCWITGPDGEQRLSLADVGSTHVLLATAPPIVVEEATGMVHRRVSPVDPALAQRLLLMPPVPLDALEHLAYGWRTIAGPDVPPPALPGLNDLGTIAPVPVLTFILDKIDAFEPRRSRWQHVRMVKYEVASARISYDYAGYRVTATTEATDIVGNGETGLIRFTRDTDAEGSAFEQILEHDLFPLDMFEEQATRPDQDWDLAPWGLAVASDFAGFIFSSVPQLQEQGWRIEYAPNWPLTITELGSDDLQFDVTTGTDWFDVTLGARVDGQVIDILPVLRQALATVDPDALDQMQHSMTIALGQGKLVQLPAEAIKPILAMLLDAALYERYGSGSLRLPRGDLAALADLEQASAGRIDWRGADDLRELARALTRIDLAPTATPPQFTAQLRPYQQTGLDWLQALHAAGFGGVLADDMGLGKTVQALAHITTLKAAGKLPAPALIVCPTSVLPNWQAEIARFAPHLNAVVWHGTERKAVHDQLAGADIIVSTYPLMIRDTALFAELPLGLVLFDEAQVLKNPRTAGFKAAKALNAPQIVALSGTPVENQLTDLWSLMELVTPGMFGALDQFKRTIDRPITRDDDPTAKAQLRRRLRPFMLRRTKDEVARDLPDKSEIPEWVDLETKQLAAYESLRLLMHKRVREEIARVGLLRSQIVLLDALLKLRQVCCDPRLLAGSKPAGSAKLDRLKEMLPELLREGRRIILFSQFTSMLDLIKPELDALGIAYVEIRGETKDRTEPVRRFQAGEVPLILISLKAGGTGLNLTAADTVILYDPWWNPAVEAQAIDRAHRIGQTKPVFVHRLIAKGTIEEKILGLQDTKRALTAMLWEGESATGTKLTEADIAYLLE